MAHKHNSVDMTQKYDVDMTQKQKDIDITQKPLLPTKHDTIKT